jgi:hypothetical protein
MTKQNTAQIVSFPDWGLTMHYGSDMALMDLACANFALSAEGLTELSYAHHHSELDAAITKTMSTRLFLERLNYETIPAPMQHTLVHGRDDYRGIDVKRMCRG